MSTANSSTALSNGISSGGDRHENPGLYFLEIAARGGGTATSMDSENQDLEEEPTELNTVNTAGGFLVVSKDKLSVKYTNVNLHGHDVGVVQANKPAPEKRLVYYFEMFVKSAGAKGQVAIGFTSESFKMRRQPGWEANSCGYHGDDGFLYRGQGKGEPFGPMYSTNDTVGSGINYASQEFFFTKNGTVIGCLYKDMKGPLFPTVAVHSLNEEIEVNFGQSSFAFDLKEYETQERMKLHMTVEKVLLPSNLSHRLVRSYLLHYGYEDTLNSFDAAGNCTIPPIHVAQENLPDDNEATYALNHRKAIRQLIRNGEVDAALNMIKDLHPEIIQEERSPVCFLLRCQKFIELVRVGELEDAVKYGRKELSMFFELPTFSDFVQECVALLAYEEPSDSSVGYLLKESQRDIVADSVNAIILATNPNRKSTSGCLKSALERLLGQLTVCCLERRALNGDQGEAFQLHRVMGSNNKMAKC